MVKFGLVWESATPPTHIWENFPKKKFFLVGLPLDQFGTLKPKCCGWGSSTYGDKNIKDIRCMMKPVDLQLQGKLFFDLFLFAPCHKTGCELGMYFVCNGFIFANI